MAGAPASSTSRALTASQAFTRTSGFPVAWRERNTSACCCVVLGVMAGTLTTPCPWDVAKLAVTAIGVDPETAPGSSRRGLSGGGELPHHLVHPWLESGEAERFLQQTDELRTGAHGLVVLCAPPAGDHGHLRAVEAAMQRGAQEPRDVEDEPVGGQDQQLDELLLPGRIDGEDVDQGDRTAGAGGVRHGSPLALRRRGDTAAHRLAEGPYSLGRAARVGEDAGTGD